MNFEKITKIFVPKKRALAFCLIKIFSRIVCLSSFLILIRVFLLKLSLKMELLLLLKVNTFKKEDLLQILIRGRHHCESWFLFEKNEWTFFKSLSSFPKAWYVFETFFIKKLTQGISSWALISFNLSLMIIDTIFDEMFWKIKTKKYTQNLPHLFCWHFYF